MTSGHVAEREQGFAGRHVVVTGAGSGIGLATTRLLMRRGATQSLNIAGGFVTC